MEHPSRSTAAAGRSSASPPTTRAGTHTPRAHIAIPSASASVSRSPSQSHSQSLSSPLLVPHSAPTRSTAHFPRNPLAAASSDKLSVSTAIPPHRPTSPTLQRFVAPGKPSGISRLVEEKSVGHGPSRTPGSSPPWRIANHPESSPPYSSSKAPGYPNERSTSRPYSYSGSQSQSHKRSFESLRAFRLRSSYDQFLGRSGGGGGGPNAGLLTEDRPRSPSRSSSDVPLRETLAYSAPNPNTNATRLSHSSAAHHTHTHSRSRLAEPLSKPSRLSRQMHMASASHADAHSRTHADARADTRADTGGSTHGHIVDSISTSSTSLHSNRSFIASLPHPHPHPHPAADGSRRHQANTADGASFRTSSSKSKSQSSRNLMPLVFGGDSAAVSSGRYKRYMSALSGRSSMMSSIGRTPSSAFSDDSTVLNGGASTYGGTAQQNSSRHLSSRHIQMLTLLFIAIFILSFFLFAVPLIIFITHFSAFSSQSLRVLMPWVRPLVFTYWCVFAFVVGAIVVVGAARRSYHTIRSRSPLFLLIVTVATVLFATWLCVALLKKDQNFLGCVASMWIFTILYPMLIVPYFFRALRISRVFDAGDSKKKAGRSSVMQALAEPLTGGRHVNGSSLAVQPSGTMGTATGGVGGGAGYETNAEAENVSDADIKAARSASELHLLKWFAVVMLPFVVIAIVQSYGAKAPMFSVLNAECLAPSDPFAPQDPGEPVENGDGGNAHSDAVVDYFTVYSILEGGFMLASIVILSNIRKEYNIQAMRREFMLSFVVYAVFLAAIIGFFLFTTRRFETELLVLSRSIALFVVSVEWPLFRTFFHTPLPFDFPHREAISSLEHVLKDPMSCVFFQQFMIEEDQDRLLKFWMEIGFFQEQVTENPASAASEAARLLSTYLAEDDTRKRTLSTPSQSHSINSINSPPNSALMSDITPLLSAPPRKLSAQKARSPSPPERLSNLDDILEIPSHKHSSGGALRRTNGGGSIDSMSSGGWYHVEPVMLSSQSLSLFLTARERRALWAALDENPGARMFDEAQAKCFDYMEKQCYPRFLRSTLCKEYLAEVDRKEAVVGRLIESRFW